MLIKKYLRILMPKDFHFGVALLGGYEKTGVSSSQVKNIDRTTTIL